MNKVNYDITNTICIFTVLSVFIAIVMIPLLLSVTINAAAVGEGGGGGLKINVHVNGAGKVCSFSDVENLGCKTSLGQGIVNFQFSEGSVAVGDKFTVCFKNNCVEKVNGPKNAPEDVFISGSKPIPTLGIDTDGGGGGGGSAYGNGTQAETPQPKKNYNPSPPNLKGQIPLFCEEVKQGNYKAAVGIANSMGLEPIDVALRGGCMGFGLGEYLSLNK